MRNYNLVWRQEVSYQFDAAHGGAMEIHQIHGLTKPWLLAASAYDIQIMNQQHPNNFKFINQGTPFTNYMEWNHLTLNFALLSMWATARVIGGLPVSGPVVWASQATIDGANCRTLIQDHLVENSPRDTWSNGK